MQRPGGLPRPPLIACLLLSAALVAAVAVLRLVIFPAYVLPIAHAVPQLAVLWMRRRSCNWLLAAALVALTGYEMLFTPAAESYPLSPEFTLLMVGANTLVVAAVLHLVLNLYDRLGGQNVQLREVNAELEAANDELRAREEEIAQQNEELQSQAEELEQQTEELAHETGERQNLNDELRRREVLLHSILEVARSFTSDPESLSEICRGALPLLGEEAAAVVIVEVPPAGPPCVRGHHGFGPQGPQWLEPRMDGTFASLVMERGATAYIEDTQLRPDITFLNIGEQRAFRSVLATPLRVRGEVAGVLKVYSENPRRWSHEQFRLLEWIATQCGLLLETLRLQQELENGRREAEEAAIRKTRFLAAVSHDIRTPVNAITLMAEMIRRAAEAPERRGELVELTRDLKGSARALVELVTDVLDIARIDSGKQDLRVADFSLAAALQAEARRLRPMAQAKGLALELDFGGADVLVRTDRLKLARVLANLIGNAVKFTDAGSVKARIRHCPDGSVHVDIADTGVGISPEHLANIFDEFYQLRNPERDHSKGTGLGLAICRRLVEALGCELTVCSDPGTGSCFTIVIPAGLVVQQAEPPVAPARLAHANGRALHGRHILLVEDHEITRRATARLLAEQGACVLEAPRGSVALQVLAHEPVQVLLLDLMLPDMDGTDVLRELQHNRPRGLHQILVITGDVSELRRQEVLGLGADDLVAKPIEIESLVEQIERGANGGAFAEESCLA